ncbi:MAG: hypothetical protein FWD71_21810, partial [Oscillospiraceae bacterium]|nr:hypothetical protein [Oscillospiraceae bacterium]
NSCGFMIRFSCSYVFMLLPFGKFVKYSLLVPCAVTCLSYVPARREKYSCVSAITLRSLYP